MPLFKRTAKQLSDDSRKLENSPGDMEVFQIRFTKEIFVDYESVLSFRTQQMLLTDLIVACMLEG